MVSVGILSSTSLDGVDELLSSLNSQTYKNLEILVAGSLTPGPALIHHLRREQAKGIQIKYVPNLDEKGQEASFTHLLKEATGEYFMLFGEGLTRSPRFIDRCVEEIGTHGTVMSSVSTHGRTAPTPVLSGAQSRRKNVLAFLRHPTSAILLGMHRTSWLRSFNVEMQRLPHPSLIVVESVLRGYVRVFDECLCDLENDELVGIELLPTWLRYGLEELCYSVKDSEAYLGRRRKLRWSCLSVLAKNILKSDKMVAFNEAPSPIAKILSKDSFSQSGEDMIMNFVFEAIQVKNPTYLDLGAHHPTRYSNTHYFYQNGSRGVNVEADPALLELFFKQRTADNNLNVGVGVGIKEYTSLPFYVMSARTLNTFSKEEAERCVAMGTHEIDGVIQVQLRDVNSIIAEYFDGNAPDFISIDVEGLDFEIVKSIDFQQYRPAVLCVETIVFSENYDGVKLDEIGDYLSGCDYFLYADTMINSIFVDRARWRRQ